MVQSMSTKDQHSTVTTTQDAHLIAKVRRRVRQRRKAVARDDGHREQRPEHAHGRAERRDAGKVQRGGERERDVPRGEAVAVVQLARAVRELEAVHGDAGQEGGEEGLRADEEAVPARSLHVVAV